MNKISTYFKYGATTNSANCFCLILSDIHADHLPDYDSLVDIMRKLRIKTEPNVVFICGDIGTQRNLEFFLRIIASAFSEIPVFFVLGNHDAYFGTIRGANYTATQIANEFNNLFFLHNEGVFKLTDNSAVVGINGWYDARYGDENTDIMLNDFEYIDDLRFAFRAGGKEKINEVIRRVADEDAENLRVKLVEAAQSYKKVYVLTHVPPFKEVTLHMEQEGKIPEISSDKFLPYFSNKALGNVLLDVAKQYPNVRFEVICGHTHTFTFEYPLYNLGVWVMHSKYGEIEESMEIVIP